MSKCCCFSGHRSVSIYDDRIASLIRDAVKEKLAQGYSDFLVGGALGFDMLCALVISQMKSKGEDIRLMFALPCCDYSNTWRYEDKLMMSLLLKNADMVNVISVNYDKSCMHKRNRFMVERSDACICYLEHDKGGTAYTVSYAAERGLEIINIANKLK